MERAVHRELTRLQTFQTFLVSQIDQLTGNRDNQLLINGVEDLKITVENFARRLLGNDDIAVGELGLGSSADSKEQETQTEGLGYLEEHARLKSTIAKWKTKTNLLEAELNTRDEERKRDEEEIKISITEANKKFNEAYYDLNAEYSKLQGAHLQVKGELAEKNEELKRTKGIALQAMKDGGHQPKANGPTKLEKVLWEYKLLERENHDLQKRLRHSGAKRNIIERQKYEIVKLHGELARMTEGKNEELRRGSGPPGLSSSPIRTQIIDNSISAYDSGEKTRETKPYMVNRLLRKNSQLKGRNFTLVAQRNQAQDNEQELKDQLSLLLTKGRIEAANKPYHQNRNYGGRSLPSL